MFDKDRVVGGGSRKEFRGPFKFETLKEKRTLENEKPSSASFNNRSGAEAVEEESLTMARHSHNPKWQQVAEGALRRVVCPSKERPKEVCPRAQLEKHDCPAPVASNSFLGEYLRNHPMEQRVLEHEARFQKAMGRNKASVQGNYLRHKMSLMKNIELKFAKTVEGDVRVLQLQGTESVTGSAVDSKQVVRQSIKGHSKTVAVRGKGLRTEGTQAAGERPLGKKGVPGQSAQGGLPKRQKHEGEFNHLFKIIDFFDRDKSLRDGRLRIQERMKDLGKDSVGEVHSKDAKELEERESSFHREYLVKGVLGKGSYGEVRLCVNAKTKERFAVKIYPRRFLKNKVKRQNIQNERDILGQVCNEHIIKMFSVVEGVQSLYLVTEYAGRQSLHEILSDPAATALDEEQAQSLLSQLCRALRYLHSLDIVHRDIKLQNVLVNDEGQLKLIDFGFALKVPQNEPVRVFCGTPTFMSPEIISQQPYDGKASDIWAFGVCAFRMVVGTFPFRGNLIRIRRAAALQAHQQVQCGVSSVGLRCFHRPDDQDLQESP